VAEARPGDLVTLEEAGKRLGISRVTLWRRVKDLGLTVYVHPFNRRQHLLSWGEIQDVRPEPRKPVARTSQATSREAPTAESERPMGPS
jgi:hypothetical protein